MMVLYGVQGEPSHEVVMVRVGGNVVCIVSPVCSVCCIDVSKHHGLRVVKGWRRILG